MMSSAAKALLELAEADAEVRSKLVRLPQGLLGVEDGPYIKLSDAVELFTSSKIYALGDASPRPAEGIEVHEVAVYGFRHALHNMRNPKESWSKSDTLYLQYDSPNEWGFTVMEAPLIGKEDLRLLLSLEYGGSEHRKVLRTIHVQANVVPWRGMWQELDTYKVATVRNSCSTMHKLGHRDLVPDDFQDQDVDLAYLLRLNDLGRRYRESGKSDKSILMRLKHRLPEGYHQMAGLDFNYETALNMFFQRRNHAVPQWRWSGEDDSMPSSSFTWKSLCDFLWRLPYMADLARADRRWRDAP